MSNIRFEFKKISKINLKILQSGKLFYAVHQERKKIIEQLKSDANNNKFHAKYLLHELKRLSHREEKIIKLIEPRLHETINDFNENINFFKQNVDSDLCLNLINMNKTQLLSYADLAHSLLVSFTKHLNYFKHRIAKEKEYVLHQASGSFYELLKLWLIDDELFKSYINKVRSLETAKPHLLRTNLFEKKTIHHALGAGLVFSFGSLAMIEGELNRSAVFVVMLSGLIAISLNFFNAYREEFSHIALEEASITQGMAAFKKLSSNRNN